MRIVFVSSELSPLCQSGGLGEAVSGLARALGARGHEVTCVLPAYRIARSHPACPPLKDSGEVRVRVPFGEVTGRFLEGPLFPGVTVALLDVPALFDRPGIYGDGRGLYGDQALRYTTLARAAAYFAEMVRPDVLVAHDWHAALSLATLRTNLDRGANREIGAVLVVHNNAYQGVFSPVDFPLTGLPDELFHPDALEAWGSLNLLKGGLVFADRAVLVSPSYAEEVQTLAFGEGLDGLYRYRRHRVAGVANGIDVERYDPGSDPALLQPFDRDHPEGKGRDRAALLDELRLDPPPPGLFLGAVGRFAVQKGWDVLAESLSALVEQGASVALLGEGDPAIRAVLERCARTWPRQVSLTVSFDDGLARRIYGGCDGILVPSRFEPCGLVQQIAQRYGAVPIAHATGGLRDTIRCERKNGVPVWDESTGLLFSPLTKEALLKAVQELAALGRSGKLPSVQKRLMGLELSWDRAAQEYEGILAKAREEALSRR